MNPGLWSALRYIAALKELRSICIKWNFLRTNVQIKERSFTLTVIKQTKLIHCIWTPKPPHCYYTASQTQILKDKPGAKKALHIC